MARAFLTSIDLNKNELLNAIIQNLASAPGTPGEGQVYVNTTDHDFCVFLNNAWRTFIASAQKGAASGVASLDSNSKVVQNPASATTTPAIDSIPLSDHSTGKIANGWLNTGTGNGLDADQLDGQHGAYYLDRSHHTNTQLAATISDFATEVVKSRLDQMAKPTANVDLNGYKIIGLAAPLDGTDAANKAYVDAAAQGLVIHSPVKAASVGALTLSGEQTVDGVALVDGDRVLVKDQAANDKELNGIYVVSTGAWTRATDADLWAELVKAYVFIQGGSTNANSSWVSTVTAGGTLESTDVEFVQFFQAGTITGASVGSGEIAVFKQKSGSELQFKKLSDTSSVNVTEANDIISLAVLPAGVDKNSLGGSALSVANGGTGATSAADARTALSVPGKYAANIGNNSDLTFTITHSLNSLDVVMQVRKTASPYSVVEPDLEVIDKDNVKVSFNVAPTTNQYRIVVIG